MAPDRPTTSSTTSSTTSRLARKFAAAPVRRRNVCPFVWFRDADRFGTAAAPVQGRVRNGDTGYGEMKFVAVSALSHDGLVREHNEDSLVAGPFTLCAITTLTPQTLWFPVDDPVVVAVADGLGGHPAGEEASALAVRWLAHAAANLTTEAAVRDALLACNEAVYTDADRDPERLTMGTTIAGVAVTDQSVIVFNVGDSRVYRFDESGLVQLSVDDNEAPARGQIRSPILTKR